MRLRLIALYALIGLIPAAAAADPLVEISSRGEKIRAVLLKPDNPKGSVILFAGARGRLDITAGGEITKLRFNQLVRTRELYAQAGYVTLVPDIAPSFKTRGDGVVDLYRASRAFAQDIAAMVKYLRGVAPKPVVAIGTSRGSLSVANGVVKLRSDQEARPDAAVLTSAFMRVGAGVPDLTIWKIAKGNARSLDVPTLLVWHVGDTCRHTAASTVGPFRNWYQSNGRKLAEKSFSGGQPAESEPCEAHSPHGFWGLDPEVAGAITGWIGSL